MLGRQLSINAANVWASASLRLIPLITHSSFATALLRNVQDRCQYNDDGGDGRLRSLMLGRQLRINAANVWAHVQLLEVAGPVSGVAQYGDLALADGIHGGHVVI